MPAGRPDPVDPAGGVKGLPTTPAGKTGRRTSKAGRVEPAAAGAARFTVAKARLRAALRNGFIVKIAGAKPGKLRVEARSGKARVATGTATVKSDGTTTVRLQFTAAARRSLASKRIVKLTISAPGIRSAAMTLKR